MLRLSGTLLANGFRQNPNWSRTPIGERKENQFVSMICQSWTSKLTQVGLQAVSQLLQLLGKHQSNPEMEALEKEVSFMSLDTGTRRYRATEPGGTRMSCIYVRPGH